MRPEDALLTKRLLKVQAILAGLVCLLALPLGRSAVESALIGSVACMLANGFFAVWVFRAYRAQHPERILKRFYGAEAAKLMLIVGLFVLAMIGFDELNIPALLGAYLIVQVVSTLIAAQSSAHSGLSS